MGKAVVLSCRGSESQFEASRFAFAFDFQPSINTQVLRFAAGRLPADGLRSKPSSGKRSAAGLGGQRSVSAVGYRLPGFERIVVCGSVWPTRQ